MSRWKIWFIVILIMLPVIMLWVFSLKRSFKSSKDEANISQNTENSKNNWKNFNNQIDKLKQLWQSFSAAKNLPEELKKQNQRQELPQPLKEDEFLTKEKLENLEKELLKQATK